MIDLNKGDCLEGMKILADKSVELIVTSPPYYNAKDYSNYNSYEDYLDFLAAVFLEGFRVLKDGRMCCVNLSCVIEPRTKRSEESHRIPIPFHFVPMMENIGYKFLEDIIWVKPLGAAKNRNGGFYQHRQPVAYKPNVQNEYILVFQKPMNGLIDKIVRGYDDDIKKASLVTEEYEKGNIWVINPETKSNHPAAYPLKLVSNLVKYYSFVNDTVLDPFMGSGTTGVICARTNRNFIGYELNAYYFIEAKNRIAQMSIFQI